jgi:acetyl-CoA carboxylase alpha subunit
MGFRSNDLDNAPSKKRRYLEFETSLSELDAQIAQLKGLKFEGRVDVSNEIKTLEQKSEKLLKEIFSTFLHGVILAAVPVKNISSAQ